MHRLRCGLLAASILFMSPVYAEQKNVGLRPYTARYQVSYRGLSGGDLEFSLQRQGNGQYEYSSHIFPNFLGGLFASDQAEDTSLIAVNGETIRPLKFRSEDGTRKTEKDIRLDFDWSKNAVSGHAKEMDFSFDVPAGVQDRLSIQLAASLALQAGRDPGKLSMVEGNELKEYNITQENTEHVRVPAGEYDTLVLKSERVDSSSSRVTRYWYAPQLGYLPVRAERSSKGKVDIVMELKSIKFGD